LQAKRKSQAIDYMRLLYQKAKQKRMKCDFGRFAVFQRQGSSFGLELVGTGGVRFGGVLLMESLCVFWV
jgi:hypothetical protein